MDDALDVEHGIWILKSLLITEPLVNQLLVRIHEKLQVLPEIVGGWPTNVDWCWYVLVFCGAGWR